VRGGLVVWNAGAALEAEELSRFAAASAPILLASLFVPAKP
jgi:hypothetical protein